jgi:hypothetical protein
MRSYNLNIAGYLIRFESLTGGPDLKPSDRFLRNVVSGNVPDVLVRIYSGIYNLPEGTERVFHAPYAEEINGVLIEKNTNFWSIWKFNSDLFIKTIFPHSSPGKNALLKFSLKERVWDLWISGADGEIDPFEYPLDGLILYYLTVIHGDIMIHASGVNINGNGWLFSGMSGKGKSTLAKLCEDSGARVIHDDRLILRKTDTGFRMFNTPVYSDDEPRESILNKIFLVEHGTENRLLALNGASAVSLIIANCIQHHWDPGIISGLLGSVSIMCRRIPVAGFYFKADRSAIDYILENEG